MRTLQPRTTSGPGSVGMQDIRMVRKEEGGIELVKFLTRHEQPEVLEVTNARGQSVVNARIFG